MQMKRKSSTLDDLEGHCHLSSIRWAIATAEFLVAIMCSNKMQKKE